MAAAGGVLDGAGRGHGEFGPYHLRLVDPHRAVPAGPTIPLTCDVATAPTVALGVPVVPVTCPGTLCASG